MYGYTSVEKAAASGDLEAGTLYPGLSRGESDLRWGFVRKVYGILAAQLLLTTVVSAATVLNASINNLLTGSSGLVLGFAILPLFHVNRYAVFSTLERGSWLWKCMTAISVVGDYTMRQALLDRKPVKRTRVAVASLRHT